MADSRAALRLLIIGGSGFVSGTLAQAARAQGHRVWTLTRGQRPVTAGVTALRADRRDPAAFAGAIASSGTDWDVVVDCIGHRIYDLTRLREAGLAAPATRIEAGLREQVASLER